MPVFSLRGQAVDAGAPARLELVAGFDDGEVVVVTTTYAGIQADWSGTTHTAVRVEVHEEPDALVVRMLSRSGDWYGGPPYESVWFLESRDGGRTWAERVPPPGPGVPVEVLEAGNGSMRWDLSRPLDSH